MKKQMSTVMACLCVALLATSCKKDQAAKTPSANEISQDALSAIYNKGFSTADVHKVSGGYLVEGDIFLSDADLATAFTGPVLRVANTEQYRTTNLVTGLPRSIKIKVTGLGTAFIAGTDTAIARYNAQHLQLTFSRITSGTADITISGFNQGPSGGYITLGSSGFPTKAGKPYNSITLNTNTQAYGSNPNVLYVGSVIQHEMGHCIGFRHTDYFNRAYSCGGTATNEGAAGVGAILIPGTPSTADPNSFMLSCSNGGNRTFNANDIIALNYLY
ncbi:protease [Chitinophaga parva]|uniref:Protease n=1 Tax=Chitinophaga parva TaxID=2169414 RepID=A0A2T7BBC7_9BACT|nr:M57 family metalloprotease [Chitinophaga parva]PUZ21696.1 protease [Chitinophaga parva]